MSSPFVPFPVTTTPRTPANGHRRLAEASGDDSEVTVIRQLRRQVAERLTRATRAYEESTGGLLAVEDQRALTLRLITEALDEDAARRMRSGQPPLHPSVESRVGQSLANTLLGMGGLQPWLGREDVEELHAIGCDQVTVRFSDGRRQRVAPVADSDAELIDLVRRLAADAGRAEMGGDGGEERRWDRAAPILNLQLPDGSRLHAVLAVTKRPAISIRRHGYLKVTMNDLLRLGTLNPLLLALLVAGVRARLNILIAGRTGAGKTTLLRALASVFDPSERIVTIEDTYELALEVDRAAHGEVVPLQARDANIEGEGAISLSELFRTGLRMSPDRVIVGEVRGHEVIPMLNAMSQGNDGSLGTIHASSSAGVFKKLALYAAQSPERLDAATTNLLVAEAVDLVVHLGFTDDPDQPCRVITSVREVTGADGLQVASNELFRPDTDGRAIPASPLSTPLLATLARNGFDPRLLDVARTTPGGGW
ncbi:MAG: CpaF family protein [Micromonosporaceae bacterium]|nr:CpaF family protein [Micromonosporaceae bacterium]